MMLCIVDLVSPSLAYKMARHTPAEKRIALAVARLAETLNEELK